MDTQRSTNDSAGADPPGRPARFAAAARFATGFGAATRFRAPAFRFRGRFFDFFGCFFFQFFDFF